MPIPRLVYLQNIINQEAGLVVAQNDDQLPFEIKRVYWFYQVPEGQERGHHAHKKSHKVLVCQQGIVEVKLENTMGEIFNFKLDKPFEGIYVPPMYWGTYTFKAGATMICLASSLYDEEDYIRDYNIFSTYNEE